MEERFDISIVGNNVAALTAALSIADKYKVCLINPTSNWGGHFSGKMIAGEHFDLGMNLLEFTSFAKRSDDLSSYNPSIRNDCGRFFHIVENYVSQFVGVRKVDAPQMYFDGEYGGDFLIANDLSTLLKLPEDVKKNIIDELKIILSQECSLHASKKLTNQWLFTQNDYKTVSVANHGKTFHQKFIEPFCLKVLCLSTSDILAILHRIAWSPLFYPETLHNFLVGEPVTLKPTTFHYPKDGHFGSIAERLLDEVTQRKNVKIIRGKLNRIDKKDCLSITLADDGLAKSDQLIWTMDVGQYLTLVGNNVSSSFDRTSLALVFLIVNSEHILKRFSVLNVVDQRVPIYRLTNQSHCSGSDAKLCKIVAELNLDYFRNSGENIDKSLIAESTIKTLLELNIIESENGINLVEVNLLQNVLNLPTEKNLKLFNQTKQKLDSTDSDISFIGQASEYASASLNDQIIQGLKLGNQFT